MTTKDLIDAGWIEYPDVTGDRFLRAIYGMRVCDKDGVRYIVHIRHCEWPDGGESFEMRLQFAEILGWELPLYISTPVYSRTPAEVLELADSLWKALRPRYYRMTK